MDRGQYTTLSEALVDVPDPRNRRGVRYPWGLLLTLIGAAVASGNRHGRAIGRWVREHSGTLVASLGAEGGRLPSESTLRRALAGVSAEELEDRLARFGAGMGGTGAPPLAGQAIDGKQVRGAGAHGRVVHLVSLVRHGSAAVLAQAQVDAKGNEITAVPELLGGRDLSGTVTTADALLTQRGIAELILGRGGHYLMAVRENQPRMLEAISELFEVGYWMPCEVGTRYWRHSASGKGHGRLERRTLESGTVPGEWLGWPGATQVVRRTRERVILATGEVQRQTAYAVTSLPPEQAGPRELEVLWRGHRTIENRMHYVRDVTMGEDAGQAYTGSTPRAMAALRNGIIGLFRKEGWASIADALRHYGARPERALTLIGALPARL